MCYRHYADAIVDKFTCHFKSVFTCNDPQRANLIKDDYLAKRSVYQGLPLTDVNGIDTELVSSMISELAHGKALDIDGLSTEHLYYCHPSLSVILSQMFHFTLLCIAHTSLKALGIAISFLLLNPSSALVKPLLAMTSEA